MDLSDLIDRNAAFAPDKPAIRFMGSTLTYAGLAERVAATARALKSQAGIGRGDRVAILAANHPDCLVLLYACARLGAMLVPLNWRLAVPEQIYILSDASVKVLVVEQALARVVAPLKSAVPEVRILGLDFTPDEGASLADLLQAASGEGRVAQVDTSCPLLIVYTSGTTGHPKGAVLRQDALMWNAVMSQHMHDMTAQRPRALGLAAVPRRRPQYSNHACAAARRHRHSASRGLRRSRCSKQSCATNRLCACWCRRPFRR